MIIYCEICGKDFNKKYYYDRHKNRKNPLNQRKSNKIFIKILEEFPSKIPPISSKIPPISSNIPPISSTGKILFYIHHILFIIIKQILLIMQVKYHIIVH